MKQLLNLIAWCITGSVVGAIGSWVFANFHLYLFGQDLRPWLANHNMPEVAVLFSIASLFWLDWLITIGVAIFAAFTVRRRLLPKVFVFSVVYIATPWLIAGMLPTARGLGLVYLASFTASVPIFAIVAAGLVRHLRPAHSLAVGEAA